MLNLLDAVSADRYPGRGIIIGRSGDGKSAVIAYWIMGRSENSRNRVFAAEGDGLRTEPFDASKVSDPSLIIYRPVRVLGAQTIVTNGDQTDTVYDAISAGGTFESALRTRTYEPDGPNWTPRISGMLTRHADGFSYKLCLIKRAPGSEDATLRFFYEYRTPQTGTGHFLHTYAGDGNPLPSFTGEPKAVALTGGLDETAETLWRGLDAENRISLFVRFIDIETGRFDRAVIMSCMTGINAKRNQRRIARVD